MRKLVASLVILAALAGAGWVAASGLSPNRPESPQQATGKTVEVKRRSLVETETLDGTLGYLGTFSIPAQGQGTLTWIAPEGSTVDRGGKLYEVDGRPVTLLFGDRPVWRDIAKGVEGPDVRQLEENLRAMSFDEGGRMSVNERFDEASARALKRWQKALGVEQDGVLNLGEAVFLPGAVRISAHKATVGSPVQPGGEAMQASLTIPSVTVDLAAGKQGLMRAGDQVQVVLPHGQRSVGTVAHVSNVAKSDPDQGSEGSGADITFAVTIIFTDPAAAGGLVEAPVKVEVSKRSKDGVLAVPVNALLALREGGYAVEVAEGRSRRLVVVQTGLFAHGMVEVSGEGLKEGMRVVVPA